MGKITLKNTVYINRKWVFTVHVQSMLEFVQSS